MSHTDPVILALLALGETAVAADDAGHAETCPRCRAELARLTEVVELARKDSPGERLEMPPPGPAPAARLLRIAHRRPPMQQTAGRSIGS